VVRREKKEKGEGRVVSAVGCGVWLLRRFEPGSVEEGIRTVSKMLLGLPSLNILLPAIIGLDNIHSG
jgi:hypothetical protein